MAFVGITATLAEFQDGERFPLAISFGARGSHFQFLTDVIEATGGGRQRNVVRQQGLGLWRIRKEIEAPGERAQGTRFLGAHRGRAVGFRMRDWGDFEVFDQAIADAGRGPDPAGQTQVQLVKTYEIGSLVYVRAITKPVDPAAWSDEAFLDGAPADFALEKNGLPLARPADYAVDWATGVVTLASPLAAGDVLIWTKGLIHVPVTLAGDEPDWEIASPAGEGELLHFWNIDLREVPA